MHYLKVYYNSQRGKASVAEVLPALPPDMPELTVDFVDGTSTIVLFPQNATYQDVRTLAAYLREQGFETE